MRPVAPLATASIATANGPAPGPAHVAPVGEAAGVLGLADQTVAGYVKSIYRKLQVSSRAEAALEAARRGLV